MELFEALENDFPQKTLDLLSKQVTIGTKLFNIFLKDNHKFFSYPQYSSLKGDLLSYSIQKQLSDAAFTPNALYKALPVNVNNYNRSILHIKTDHFIVTSSKTYKWNKLPCSSKYKKEYAKANTGGDGQYTFDFIGQCIATLPYYGLLTYNFNDKMSECDHIDLVVPDSQFKNILHRKDLKPSQNLLYVISSDLESGDIAKLNEEFEQIVQLKTINR